MRVHFNTLEGAGTYEVVQITESKVFLKSVFTYIHRCPICGYEHRTDKIGPTISISRAKYDAFVKETEEFASLLNW